MPTIAIGSKIPGGFHNYYYYSVEEFRQKAKQFQGELIIGIKLSDMLNTPEERTEFMRAVADMSDDGNYYFVKPEDWGYRSLTHCREELSIFDPELCFRFFPDMRGEGNEVKQEINSSVAVGGGSSIIGSAS